MKRIDAKEVFDGVDKYKNKKSSDHTDMALLKKRKCRWQNHGLIALTSIFKQAYFLTKWKLWNYTNFKKENWSKHS